MVRRATPGLGVEFFDAVDAAIDHIVELPGAGSRIPGRLSTLPVRRVGVARFPYHVIYLERPAGIRILAIAHDRRRPRTGRIVFDKPRSGFVSPTPAAQPRGVTDLNAAPSAAAAG